MMKAITVDKAIAPLEKVRRNLEYVVEWNTEKRKSVMSKIRGLEIDLADVDAEHEKARKILDKFNELLT